MTAFGHYGLTTFLSAAHGWMPVMPFQHHSSKKSAVDGNAGSL
jgi:hypothetical protein